MAASARALLAAASPCGRGMSEPVQAAIYCRMSLAKFGDATKVEDQARICRDLADRRGWKVITDDGYPEPNGVYSDNNSSAWQPNRKRPGWDRMLKAVDEGRVGAIVTYHGDRLVRRHEDLSALLNFAKAKGVRLASPTGESDLDDYDDQFKLEIEVSVAKRESANTSRRRKQQYERWRREGRIRAGGRGGRPYGFATDAITHVSAETAFIREAAGRVLGGEPVGVICRDLNARGARMPTGRPFDHGAMKKMLMRPRLAGLMPDGEHEAAWAPVLEQATWEAVCAVLKAKATGFSYATNARRYLLSGIARCGLCGEGLTVNNREKEGRPSWYRCTNRDCKKVHRDQPHLDEYVITRTLAKLGDPRNPQARLPEYPALAGEFRGLALRRAQTEEMIADPGETIPIEVLRRRLKLIDARLAELRQLAAGNASARLLGSHAGLSRQQFDGLPLSTRRALVAACFRVTVLPSSKRGPGFRTEDLRLDRP